MSLHLIAASIVLGVATCAVAAADLPFVNWENHPQHGLDLSPDGRLLAVAHTADQRVQLFDLRGGAPALAGHVMVGVDPVSVRFRNDGELWVVNHISDSVSVIDVASRRVTATLQTSDEPFDVVFAAGKAFVSCSQANRVEVFDLARLEAPPLVVAIAAEDPRALAVSRDGRSVYAAIFESGNATTILAGGLRGTQVALPNVVSDSRGPYGGRNPPPNKGQQFEPPVHTAATPPPVGLIVRRGSDRKWRDDNNADWTAFVSGDLASASGRRVGWDLSDRDLAIIDVSTLSVRYVTGLMNINMALAVNPATGEPVVVGTEAFNEVRFEPNVNGRFVRVHLARVAADGSGSGTVRDLNPHIDYQQHTVAQSMRDQAIGDPRAITWRADGLRGWVAGMGSNNVVAIDAQGQRLGAPISVGEGPVALVSDDARGRLYVWNHFDASLSVVDPAAGTELQRIPVFNPLPKAIREGRPFLYDTHRTSGLGQVSCGACHVDGRMDRLAWDLGDPSQPPQAFDQNCISVIGQPRCEDFHAMKGPMTTQTMQDIIGNEPFHWRGDRTGIEAFNPAFEGLLGDDRQLTALEMQAFEDFLATITFPPNPYRQFDNALPAAIPLAGHFTSGRFSMAGQPLGTGDPRRGLNLYTTGLLDSPFQCSSCHTLPTGMASNGPLLLGVLGFPVGGSVMAAGPMGANHLGIVSTDGSTNVSIKVPHLRNQYEKTGFNLLQTDNAAGFGFLHDGSVDSLSTFLSARTFSVNSDRDVADLVALMLAFSGSDFAGANPLVGAPPPLSRDSHAAVGAQLQLSGGAPPPRHDQMLALARTRAVDLVVHTSSLGWTYDAASDRFVAADDTQRLSADALRALASATAPQTWSAVSVGLGRRLGTDRDGDGVGDARELAQGSDPADAQSKTLQARAGLWFNPERGGHGFDLQYLGQNMFVLWYTYNDDGTPTWYLAVGPRAQAWRGDLQRFTLDPASGVVAPETVGELRLEFSAANRGNFHWQIGTRNGSESVQPLIEGLEPAFPDRTGSWYDLAQPGWGVTIYTVGDVRVSLIYYYDGNNQPRWALGQGSNLNAETLTINSYTGFCPDCAAVQVGVEPVGQLRFDFAGARQADFHSEVRYPGTPESTWRRGPVHITPLSQPPLRPELH